MNFGSLPQFPSDGEERSPARGPLPDRHSTEFAVGVLVAVAAGGVVLFVLSVLAIMLFGAPVAMLA